MVVECCQTNTAEETSTFGLEHYVAVKTAIEQQVLEGLRYKLWMMDIPLDGESNIFCDNY